MMIVYHGGTDIIPNPLVSVGRDELDFGKGFYVTDIRSQAETWAQRIAGRRESAPVLNIYEFDLETAITKYRHKKFKGYDKEWLDFIAANRCSKEAWKDFDLIMGGVADDRVVDTVESYIAELMSEEIALKRLAQYAPNNQLCITHQGLADECLHFVESIILQTE